VPQEYLLLLASRCPGAAKACSLSLDQLKNTVTYLELLQFAFKQRRPPYTWKTTAKGEWNKGFASSNLEFNL
jgi:hypothetical protein